jgi:uncharacterized protein involved in oxidation of intracellular sulfur
MALPTASRRPTPALRLAVALAARDDTSVQVFLKGDAVTCAASGQKTPDGYYALDRMLRSFRKSGDLACYGTAWTPEE